MSEKNNIDISKEMSITRAYFIFLIVVLMLVQIVDTYCTVVLGAIPSQIAKEFLSEWFIMGLEEFGITEEQYHKMSQKEKNEVKKTLAEFGHC